MGLYMESDWDDMGITEKNMVIIINNLIVSIIAILYTYIYIYVYTYLCFSLNILRDAILRRNGLHVV